MQTDYASAPSQKILAWAAEVVDDVNFFLSSSTVYELQLNEWWKIPVHLGTHAKSAVAVVKTQNPAPQHAPIYVMPYWEVGAKIQGTKLTKN